MSRSNITFNDVTSLVFNTVKKLDCKQLSSSEFGDEFKEFVILKFENKSKTYVLFLKPLTPSSRNPEKEYNFQIIESQRNKIQDLAKKVDGNYIYAGWAQDKGCILVPASEKVDKSANQGSVFLSVEKYDEIQSQLQDNIYVRKISRDENYYSHCFLEENLGEYINLLNNDTVNLVSGSVPTIEDEGMLKFVPILRDTGEDLGKVTPIATATSDVQPLSIVLYGPPGTGKTKGANLIVEEYLKKGNFPNTSKEIQIGSCGFQSEISKSPNWYSLQFHPSFSYEDFFEGLRPVQNSTLGSNDISYEVIPGVFKVISQLARASYQPGDYGIEVTAHVKEGSILQWLKEEGGISELYRFQERDGYFSYNETSVLITGKETEEKELIKNENDLYTGPVKIKWYSTDVQPGNFILFIDELNRGNPAKIFGEALSLIEPSKRLGCKEQASLNLPYSHEKFCVPPNLHTVATMNSSDKSLAHLDQAFRRRFKFVYLAPDFSLIVNDVFSSGELNGKIDKQILEMVSLYFEIINDSLKDCGIDSDNFIGHSYAIDMLKKMKITVENLDKPNQLKLLTIRLVRLWQYDLHGLIRDIVGQYNISDFSEKFYNKLLKNEKKLPFLKIDENLKQGISDYLACADPSANKPPLDEAS